MLITMGKSISRNIVAVLLVLCTWALLSRFLDTHRLPLQRPVGMQVTWSESSKIPFTGAFARFPHISSLPETQRRLTVVGVWNNNNTKPQLRHFFHTVQLNNDSVDLLLVNRRRPIDAQCIDFDEAGIDISWGGNVKVVCMDDEEWERRLVSFLCSPVGWDCTPTQRQEVHETFQKTLGADRLQWRPLLGYAFRDLFIRPENSFWGWIDVDTYLGNFARYPFNFLSQVSLLTGTHSIPEFIYMAGQLTAFNFDDENLVTAWKGFPALQTADHYTKQIDGEFPITTEEQYWSHGYLRSDPGFPGANLSYGVYSDMQGDDWFDNKWTPRNANANQTYVASGREVLLVSVTLSRLEIEELIKAERETPIDDLGGLGWTGGEDGSGYLLEQPHLSSAEAKSLAVQDAERRGLHSPVFVHAGTVEDQILNSNCSSHVRDWWKVCVTPDPLMISEPAIMKASVIRFKGQQPNHVLRRLERDTRPRGYERKLIRHHLFSKRHLTTQLPPFVITDDLVLRYNMDKVEVFPMGLRRNETLYLRKPGEPSIG